MCSATGIAVLQAGAGAYEAQAQLNEGSRQNKYYRYMASMKDTEARLVRAAGERQVGAIQDNASRDSRALNDELKRVQGAQRVAQAASGMAPSGSAEDVAGDTISKAKADELAIRFNADSASQETLRQADFEGMNLRNEASGFRAAGRNAKSAAKTGAFATLLGRATQVADTWYKNPPAEQPKASNYVPDYRGQKLGLESAAPMDPRLRRALQTKRMGWGK